MARVPGRSEDRKVCHLSHQLWFRRALRADLIYGLRRSQCTIWAFGTTLTAGALLQTAEPILKRIELTQVRHPRTSANGSLCRILRQASTQLHSTGSRSYSDC